MPTDPNAELRAWVTLAIACVGFLLSLSNWWRQRERKRLLLIPYKGEATDKFFYRIAVINTGNVPMVVERVTVRREAYKAAKDSTESVANANAVMFDISKEDEAFTLKPQEAKTFNETKHLFWGPIVFDVWTVDGKVRSKSLEFKESLSHLALQNGKQAADLLTAHHSDQRDWGEHTYFFSSALYDAVKSQTPILLGDSALDEEAASILSSGMREVFTMRGRGDFAEVQVSEEYLKKHRTWLNISPTTAPNND